MAKKNFWEDDKPVAQGKDWWSDDKPAAQKELPAGVQPSGVDGGRGVVTPPTVYQTSRDGQIAEMADETDPTNPNYSPVTANARAALQTDARGGMDAKRSRTPGRVLDADIPPMTAGSVAQDVAAGALQIIPTTVKGVGDIARLATGDRVGKGISDYAEGSMKAAQDLVGSDRAALQRRRFDQDMADPALNAADVLVGNPGALSDQVLPTVGSMALPIGASGLAGKLATGSRAAKVAAAIDAETVAARAKAAQDAAVIGTTVAQNAGDTYSTVRDAGGDQGQAYLAAAITAPATYLAGRLTEGGAEGHLARAFAGKAERRSAMAIPKAMAKEGAQEMGEEVGQYTGETTGLGHEFDANTASKRLAVAGTLGAVVGGGTDIMTGRIQKLKDAGETEAAKVLERQQAEASVDTELGAMGDAAAHPDFQAAYRERRTAGLKPAEAAARAGMDTGFGDLAATAGVSDKAVAAAREKAAKMPLDQVPGFLERFLASLASKGIGKPLPAGAAETALGAVRNDAMDAVLKGVYGDTPAASMDEIQKMEQQQAAPPAAPAADFDPGNDVIVTPETEKVHTAATSPLNDLPEPTQAQKEAGNYKVGRMRVAGMDISVENPQGSTRSGTAADGTQWETPMQHHYGYFRGTLAADGDKLDVFVKPGTPENFTGPVFVVDQVDPKTGAFDEHKTILGATSRAEAIYRSNYDKNWNGMAALTELPMDAFKTWARSGHLKEPLDSSIAHQPEAVPAVASQAEVTTLPTSADNSSLSEQPDAAIQRKDFSEADAKRRAKANRLRAGAFEKNPLMAFLGKHGLHPDLAAEFAPGSERRRAMVPGYGPVFRKTGVNIDLLAERAAEEGFLPPGSTDATDLYNLIAKAFRGERVTPQYAAGAEADLQAQSDARFEDYMAAQQDADPLAPEGFLDDELDQSGYTTASPEIQAQVRALLDLAEARGIDTEAIREDASRLTADQPEQAYYDAAKTALEEALTRSGGDGRQAAGQEGVARGAAQEVAPPPATPEPPAQTPADAGVSASGFEMSMRDSGTLAIKGNQDAILAKLKAGGITKTMIMNGGIMVGKTQAAKAQALLEGKPADAPAAKPLMLGTTPGDAEAVTVKNGTIYVGKYEAVDFDSGEPVKAPAGATDEQIKAALRDAGVLGNRQKFFGGAKEEGAPEAAPVEFVHEGTRIYPTLIAGRDGAPPSQRWAVESSDNKQRRQEGDRNRGGDSLHETVDAAKAAAEFEAKQHQQAQARRSEIDAREQAAREAADAKREANKGMSLTEIKAQKYLEQDILDGATGKTMTRADWVQGLVDGGGKLSVAMVNRIKPLSRSAFNRATNQEQAAHDKKVKDGGTVPEYSIGEFIVSKTEYDHAQKLMAVTRKQDSATDPLAQNRAVNADLKAMREKDAGYKAPADVAAALRKLGATPDSTLKETDWSMPTRAGKLGDVFVSFDPVTNEATIRAEWSGKEYGGTKAKGAAAIAEAVERARDGIDAGVNKMVAAKMPKTGELPGSQAAALTSPTAEDVTRQQDRAANADELDQRDQIDREAEGQTLTAQDAPEQRKDTTGDVFGGPTAEEVLADRRRKEAAKAKPAAEGGLFGEAPVAGKIENFGEKLPPARRALAAKLNESLSDDDIAKQPLSQIWPLAENEAIEDPFAAAVAHAARAEVPAKPRTAYKVKRWAEKVQIVRSLAGKVLDGTVTRERFMDKAGEFGGLDNFIAKVRLLEQIDRANWGRIGEVREAPDAIQYVDGGHVETPMVAITVDDRSHWLQGSGNVDDHVDAVKMLLGKEQAEKRMEFDIRTRRSNGSTFINKKGDSQHRPLMEFKTVAEARAAIKDQYADLVQAWDGVKARDNISERDVRSDENRQRTGQDWRKGRDVSAEEFGDTFGFKGGEFGKWVSQGAGAHERQFFLNGAYDALRDLADIVGIPPKAISLNGTLGIAFGSRGSGWASAHFEPSNLVINLTKPRGAGSLAHEWFHALDNYFARERGGEVPFNGSQTGYRDSNYITHRPEPLMVMKGRPGTTMTKGKLEALRAAQPGSKWYDAENWVRDPKHPEGVRPEVEARFADLVDALDKSPMAARSRLVDGIKESGDGYWSRTLERAARSFENYVISRMLEKGYHNDFLANVRPAEETGKNLERYPYLLPTEIGPVADAFKALFDTVKTRETDAGTAMFARAYHGTPHTVDKFSTDKIGSGEGAQAFGWGLYFASKKEIADHYRGKLSNNQLIERARDNYDESDNPDDAADALMADPDLSPAQRELLEALKADDWLGFDYPHQALRAAFRDASNFDPSPRVMKALKEQGALYEVEIPEDNEMLDWDKTLEEQPPKVKAALEGTDYEIGLSERELEKMADEQIDAEAQEWADENDGDPVDYSNNADRDKYIERIRRKQGGVDSSKTGRELYRMMMHDAGYRPQLADSEDYQRDASATLLDLGIKGIKYLDGGSRKAGDGSHNYVVFSGDDVAIQAMHARPPLDVDQFRRAFGMPTGMSQMQVQRAVNELSSTWSNGPPVQVVDTYRDLPGNAPSDARGFYDGKQAWIVAAAQRSRDDVARTLGHEVIAHHGLRQILSPKDWDSFVKTMNLALASGNKPLNALRDTVRRAYVDDAGNFNLSKKEEADEIAARAVEEAIDPKTGEFRPGYSWLKSVWAKVADFLRSMGITVKFTNAELQGMLVASMKNLEAGQRTAGGAQVVLASRGDGSIARGHPRGTVTLKDGITGPTGAKLTAYTWQWKPVDLGEDDKTARVSDWDKAEVNPETGRDVVHQFIVDGKTVSLETATRLLGFNGATAGPVKSMASSVKTLARLQMQLAETETVIERRKSDEAAVAKMALPPATGPDEKKWFSMGDAQVRQPFDAPPLTAERRRVLESAWRENRMKEKGWPPGSSMEQLNSKAADLRDRIKRAEKKVNATVSMASDVLSSYTPEEAVQKAEGEAAAKKQEDKPAPPVLGKKVTADQVDLFNHQGGLFARAPATDTPEFKRWFGDSEVVDADGKPLVVYHGTTAEFSEFSAERAGASNAAATSGVPGFYFAMDTKAADHYAGKDGQVIPAYLSLRNPAELNYPQLIGGTYERAKLEEAGHDGALVMRRGKPWAYIVFNPEQIKSATGNNGDFDASNPSILFARGTPDLFAPDSWSIDEPGRIERLTYELQDSHIDLKKVQQAITDAGHEIADKWDARLAETLYPGRVAVRSEAFLKGEAKPLLAAMARDKVTMDELSDYLIARHAPERNKQVAKVNPDLPDGGAGRNSAGTLMTNDNAAAYLAGLDPKRMEVLHELAQKVDAITKGTRQLLVAEGLEKADTVAAWEGAYQNYVPLFKEEAEAGGGNAPPHPIGSGFTVKGPASKRSTGSTKGVTNVLAHVLMQREAAITRAEKNRVALSLYGLALTNPNPGFWTTIKPGMTHEAIGHELAAMGVDPTVAEAGMAGVPTIRSVDPLTQKKVDRPNPMYKQLPGAITLKVNGEDRVLLLNTKTERGLRMAESLKNLDGITAVDWSVGLLHKWVSSSISPRINVGNTTRWLAAVNTQYNPAFGLANLTRDVLEGAINVGSTQLRGKASTVLLHVPAALQGIARGIAGGDSSPWSKLYKQFREDGAQTGYRESFRDAFDRSAAIERELAHLSSAGKLTPGRAGHAFLDLLDGFNTTLENAVRLSAYKTALDQGISRPQAARLARELTVDFNRKGRAGRELGPLYAFFNASVQGAERALRTLTGPTGAKVLAGGLMLGVMQALMLAAAGYDDDEIPEFVKTRAFIIPLPKKDGQKHFIAIPMPLGFLWVPNAGRVLTELTLNGGKDIGKRVFDAVGTLAGSFNPLGGGNIFTADGALRTVAPTIIDPIVELDANKNFAGNPIEKVSPRGELDARPGYQRAKESTLRSATGQVYLGISKAINALTGGTAYEGGAVSPTPERIKYIAEVIGGGVLREVSKTIDASVKKANGEPVKMSGIPIAGRFYGEVDDDQVQQTRYYDQGKKLTQMQSSMKAAQQAGDGEALAKMLQDHPEAAMIRAHDKVQAEIAKLNKLAVSTVDDPATSKVVDQARVERMKALNEAMQDLEKASGKVTLGQKLKGAVSPAKEVATAP